MIPDDVEKIIMTKEDYDRNVEQLLLEKIELQERIDKAIKYINDADNIIIVHTINNDSVGDINRKILLKILKGE